MDEPKGGFKPPYMSFQTFWNFISELASKPVPPRIDRSLMGSKSGTDQNNLTAALTAFELIDDAGTVSPRLRQLASTDEEGRKPILADIVRQFYAKPLAVSEANDTEAALHDAFRDEYGLVAVDTRRKCETFFLHAMRIAGLPVSPHFKQTRPGPGAPGAPKPKRAATRRKPAANGDTAKTPPPSKDTGNGRTQTVTLKSGGWVSLSYDFNLFDVDEEDESFVIGIVKMLRAYQAAHPAQDDEGGAS